MKKLKLLLLFAIVGSPYAISESNNTQLDYSSFYFNLGGGWGYISNLPTGAGAINAGFGYDFNHYLGLEAEWIALPSSQWGMLSNYNIYTIDVKGNLPLNQYWSLYGKLGSGAGYSSWSGTLGSPPVYNTENSATSWLFQGGVGIELNLGGHFHLYLEDNMYIPLMSEGGAFANTNATLFGFRYSFSAPSALSNENNLIPTEAAINSKTGMPLASSTAPAAVVNNVVPIDNLTITAASVTIAADALTESKNQESKQVESSVAPIPVPLNRQLNTNEMTPLTFKERIITQANGRRYIVIKANDTLFSIAKNSNIPLARLRKINYINSQSKIEIGSKFYLN